MATESEREWVSLQVTIDCVYTWVYRQILITFITDSLEKHCVYTWGNIQTLILFTHDFGDKHCYVWVR